MDLTQMIAQVGFPIAMAAWLLLKMEKQLESAADVGRHLGSLLEAHLARYQECQERRFGLPPDELANAAKKLPRKAPRRLLPPLQNPPPRYKPICNKHRILKRLSNERTSKNTRGTLVMGLRVFFISITRKECVLLSIQLQMSKLP